MPAMLLQTKLYLPQARPDLVARPRLMERLDQAWQPGCRVVLVSAPAGFGKTTLAAQWLAAQTCPVGWLGLDESDNAPVRFLRYLCAALQPLARGAGQGIEALAETARLDLDETIGGLANDLAQSAAAGLLVLDDYHVIHAVQVHQVVRLLIDALPPDVRLMVLSREDPPVPLARLRARGQLVELRPGDLRFTMPEAAGFFNQLMHLGLDDAQVRALEERTEGWAAGLQMAALALQNSAGRDDFIRSFSGTHRFVLDYLVEEVLVRQPQDVQRFLLETCILNAFNAALCAAVTGQADGAAGAQAMLDRLERANLFIVALDDQRCWYRYHHLFADLLRARLKSADPQLFVRLHERASVWMEAHQDAKSAVDHALAAQNYGRMADLLENYLPRYWIDPDLNFFQMVNQLPLEVLHSRAALCLQSAWFAVLSGQIERLPALIEAAEKQLGPLTGAPALLPAQRGLIAFARVLRAYVEDMANRAPQLDDWLEQAVESVPEENVGMRNSIAVVLGTIYFMEGDAAAAARYFNDAIERDMRANGTNAVPIAGARWARLLIVGGRLREAERLCREKIAYMEKRGARQFYVAGNLYVQLGLVLREWDRLEEARKLVEEGLNLHQSWPVPQALMMAHSALAKIALDQGDLDGAAQAVALGNEIMGRAHLHPDVRQGFETVRVRLWSAQGLRDPLEQWAAAKQAEARPFHYRHEEMHLGLARALLALDRTDEALALLKPTEAAAAAGGRLGHQLEALALMAAHLPPQEGRACLQQALRLGEPQGYVRVFLEKGLAAGLKQGGDLVLSAANRRLVEPLSAREMEVLRLAAEGLSNQAIAGQLYISIRTVKKHLQNIYAKLEADGRVQAIVRARENHLL